MTGGGLLLGMEIITALCITGLISGCVTSASGRANGKRWLVMGEIDGYFIFPRRRAAIQNRKSISPKVGNCDLEVLTFRVNFGDI